MYASKILLTHVIKLFSEKPAYRDKRYETIEYIVKKHYKKQYGKNVCADFRLTTGIDRAFRAVQQFEPSLRGRNWITRQRKAGEISAEEYEKMKEAEDKIRGIMKQLKLFN